MGLLLSFFSVLKSEINWLISLVSSANTDTDQAQADRPAPHDAPANDHHAAAKDALIHNEQPADTAVVTESHHKEEAAQLSVKLADDSNDPVHQAPTNANDDGTDAPHGSGSVFAFDLPAVSDHPNYAMAPAPGSFTLASLNAPLSANSATVGDLNIHPLPSFGGGDEAGPSFKGGHSGGGGGQGTGSAWTEYVTASGTSATDPGAAGLTFKLTFDQSQASLQLLDPNFQAAVEAVAKQLAGQFDNHVTVSIDVGYGEVEGFKLGSALGESITDYTPVSGVSTAAQYAELQGAYGTLIPASDPMTGKHTYWVTTAEGRALGLSSSVPTYDGYVGLQSAGKQDFSLTDIVTKGAPAAGEYDGIGTIAHEFTEVMGRQTSNGAKSGGSATYMPLDLFHFSSDPATFGQLITSGTAPGYFALHSIDWNGDTALKTDVARSFNTKVGDHSDWAPGTTATNPPDAYDASGGLNSVSPISHVDFLVMEAVGWHASGAFTGVWG